MSTSLIKRVSLYTLLFVAVGAITFAEATAQTLHYKTESRVKLHGMGALGNMIGNKPTTSDNYVDEMNMLSNDDGRNASIFSVADEKIISMDRKKKTYFEMGFDEFASMFEAMGSNMQANMEDSGVESTDLQFDIRVEETGESAMVAGYNADKKILIMKVEYAAQAAGDDGAMQEASGNMYAVSEIWVSKDVPGYEILESFGKNYAEKAGEIFTGAGGGFAGMQQAFMADGRLSAAMEKLAEESKKLEGMQLKTISYVVLTPEGEELDLQAVLDGPKEATKEEKKQKRRRGLGNLARNALRGRGVDVGSDPSDQEDMNAPVESQRVLTETETIYTLIEVVSDDPDRFKVPGNFKQVEAPNYGDMR